MSDEENVIEKDVIDYLSVMLNVPVFAEVPETPSEDYPVLPTEFVVIDRFSGGDTNKLQSASIAIQSYSLNSLYDAILLDRKVRTAMGEMADHVERVSGTQLTGDTNFTDTRSKRYRYQCTYFISHY